MERTRDAVDATFIGDFRIDRESPVPAYHQVEAMFIDRIATGVLPPHSQLPSERELTDVLGVSRMTLRQALGRLVQDGRLVRKQGTGTFVADDRFTFALTGALRGVGDEIRDSGAPGSQVRLLSLGSERPPVRVAEAFGLDPAEPVIEVRRLRLVRHEPLSLSTSWLQPVLCAALLDTDLEGRSLYRALVEVCGLSLARGVENITAVALDAEAADLLATDAGAPAFRIQRTTWSDEGEAVEVVDTLLRSDRFSFEAHLTPPETATAVDHVDLPVGGAHG